MKTLKALQPKKLVIWSLIVMFSFLQVVPTGFAANAPVNQADARSGPAAETPVTDTTTNQTPTANVAQAATTIDSLMNTGGISSAATTEVVTAVVENPIDNEVSSENLTDEQLQARIDQLLEEASALEEQATQQIQRASELNEQAALARKKADELIRKSQEELAIAQALMPQGQSMLNSANKEMSVVTAREKKVREQLASYQKRKPTREILQVIAKLKNELNALASQKASIARKMAKAYEILRNAQQHQQLAVAAKTEVAKSIHLASELSKQAASLYAQAQALMAQAAAKIAEAEELKTHLVPPAVQAYADALRSALGDGFEVSAEAEWGDKGDGPVYNGFYLIKVVNKAPKTGMLEALEMEMKTDGTMMIGPIYAAYTDIGSVDGQLLYESMKQIHVNMSDPEVVALMSKVEVDHVDAAGGIYFFLDGGYYHCVKDGQGAVRTSQLIPPAAQPAADLLTQLLGADVSISAVRQADGTYYLSAVRGDVGAQGTWKIMNFILAADGALLPDSIHTIVFEGINADIDAKLLYDGMKLLQPGSDPDAVALLSQITVSSVDANGAIYFTNVGKNYKAYRDADGTVKVEEVVSIPPAVQALVDQLNQSLAGTPFRVVSMVPQTDGNFLVSLGGALLHTSGRFHDMFFVVSPQGIVTSVSNARYFDTANVDGQLLFDGLKTFAQKNDLLVDVQALVLMTQITVNSVDANGAIFFTKDGKNYKTYRDSNGTVKVEVVTSIPSTVQSYVDTLQQQVGSNFKVTAALQKDGKYLITVADELVYAKAPTSGLHQMSFSLSTVGLMDPASLQASYYSINGDITVDAALLFEALQTLVDDPTSTALAEALANYERNIALATQESEAGNADTDRANAERAAAEAAQHDAADHQNQANAFQQKISAANACIGGNIGVCNGNGWPVAVRNGQYYVPDSTKTALQGNIGVWSQRVMNETRAAADELDAAADHYNASQAYATQAAQHMQQAVAYANAAKNYFLQVVNYQKQLNPLTLVAMTKISVIKVENGAIFFTEGGVNYKTYRDSNGTVKVERMAVPLPADVLQTAQASLSAAELAQLNTAMLDFGPNSQYAYSESLDDKEKSWTWTSEDGTKTYVLSLNSATAVITPGSPEDVAYQKFQSYSAAATSENNAAQADLANYNNEVKAMNDDQVDANYHQSKIDQFQSEITKANVCIGSSSGNECRAAGYTDQSGPASAALKQTLQQSIATWSSYIANEAKGKSDALNAAASHASAASAAANRAQQHASSFANYTTQAQTYYQTISSLVNPDETLKVVSTWSFSTTTVIQGGN